MTQSRHATEIDIIRIKATGLRYKFISQKIGCTLNDFSAFVNNRRKLNQIDRLIKFLDEYEDHNEWIARF